ncbi:MAG: phosphatidylserine decarboxylase [Proteobacteria bacterium]|nr:phosphatidylserine decarboxylase [Pseudomonadota bacterium]
MNLSALDTVLTPIRREGWPFILGFALASVALALVATPLAWIGAAMTGWCVYFFRDPARMTPIETGLVISPADGLVQSIGPALPPPELGMEARTRTRISIFMNVFDVHVNRAPMDGVITALAYRPGKFFNASLDKASEFNERMSLRMTSDDGKDIAVVQIAGLLARRILCWVDEGQSLRAGERFGMIRFGSRVDIYLDDGMVPLAIPGQSALAGETVLARSLAAGENATARTGEER